MLGRTLGSATVALIQGTIVFLVCLAAGFRPAEPLLLPLALLFMALIAIMCTAIGTAVGSVLEDMQGFQLIMNFIVLPLFFFSSALFPVLPGSVTTRREKRDRAPQLSVPSGGGSKPFGYCPFESAHPAAASNPPVIAAKNTAARRRARRAVTSGPRRGSSAEPATLSRQP